MTGPLPLTVADEVAAALAEGRAVVAMESTLITHGLPRPDNVETALAMEAAARDAGAVPATVAVLGGRLTVGLGGPEIERLGAAPPGAVRKCSRRDLPVAIGLGEDGATTVAATMMVARMAGIDVFATGGIGGVHRGHPHDVSADLIELGRTPVAVVCAGPKSILDLPLTLEVLETQGVPVIGLGTDGLPAFYARDAGLPVSAVVADAAQAARVVAAWRALDGTNGLLFAVPIPDEHALPLADVEDAIARATEMAGDAGIQGAAVTPFVLGKVAELTGGRSLAANKALLVHNAGVAAEIAVAAK